MAENIIKLYQALVRGLKDHPNLKLRIFNLKLQEKIDMKRIVKYTQGLIIN